MYEIRTKIQIVVSFVLVFLLVAVLSRAMNTTEDLTENTTSDTAYEEPLQTENISLNVSKDDAPTPPISSPQISVDVKSTKATRGDVATIEAEVRNVGETAATITSLKWQLPEGFEKISEENNCVSLSTGEACASKITARILKSAQLGGNSVVLSVGYR